jgi:hypothetical protein
MADEKFAASERTDELLTIGDGVPEPSPEQAHREAAVRLVASGLIGLAWCAFVFGLVWIVAAFGQARMIGQVKEVHESRFLPFRYSISYLTPVENETAKILMTVAPSVVFAIVLPWLLVRTAQGLRALSSTKRRVAFGVLGLTLVVAAAGLTVALGQGDYLTAIGYGLTVLAPIAAIIVLTGRAAEAIFSPKYRALVANRPDWQPRPTRGTELASKGLVLLFGLGALFLLFGMLAGE